MASGRGQVCKMSDQPKQRNSAAAGFTSSARKCQAPSKGPENTNNKTSSRAQALRSNQIKESLEMKKKKLPKASRIPLPIGRKIQQSNANPGAESIESKGSRFESSCIECMEKDNIHMVQCDNCDLWAHFKCVGVGPEIANLAWCCRFCRTTPTDSSVKKIIAKSVDSSVGTEPKKYVSVGTNPEIQFHFVKNAEDLEPTHLSLADEATYNFYEDKLAMFRGSDMHSTVKEIAQNMISDNVLKDYSYLGRRKKLPFIKYDNITRVIISSTIRSMNSTYRQKFKKDKEETDTEKEKFYKEVEDYFTKEYIKKAADRLKAINKID